MRIILLPFALAAALIPLTGRSQEAPPDSQDIISALLPLDMSGRRVQGARSVDGILDAEASKTMSGRGVKVVEGTSVPYIDLRVAFEYDSDVLSNDGVLVLQRLAAALVSPELEQSKFRIVGHTDANGSDAYNEDLSRRRADSVFRWLTNSSNIRADRLEVSFRGERELLPDISPEDERNRRVEIQNIGSAQ